MVTGLDIFTEHFKQYTNHYILIGGSACDWQLERKGIHFRTTKDLDIILVVEALSDEFIRHFWTFIKDGEYSIAEVDEKKSFYRFIKPNASAYPKMIELFARRPDLIKERPGMHLTDIPTGEDVSSLSAILLDDDYYKFTIANTVISDNLHLANEAALICLKVRAFLNNRSRKEAGQLVREDDIIKHKKDIIRLTVTLPATMEITVPDIVRKDLRSYIEVLKQENIDIKQLLKNQGIGNVTQEQIIDQLIQIFKLNDHRII